MEILDVYNEKRQRTGRTHIRGNPVKKGDYILVVHVWILNDKDEFLIQKRQPWKKLWPGMWDCAVAGAALVGDDSAGAAVREAKEELDVDLDIDNGHVLFTDKFSFGFDDIWIVKQNLDISSLKLQQEEVAQVKWASEKEIREMAAEDKFVEYYYLDKLFKMIFVKQKNR
jgi:isopentenyldiphosphate isomerase